MGSESTCFEPSTIIFFFLCLVVKFKRLVLACMKLVDFIEGKLCVFDPFWAYCILINTRFLAVRKEIHNHYTDNRKTAVSKVKDAGGKMVGPVFKTMKSELVAW
jgi:hypothetical protein